VVSETLFGGVYAGKTALVTGHTGFKGSWLALWLEELGCRVVGFSLGAATDPNHFAALSLRCHSVVGDLRDRHRLVGLVREYRPDIIFHLAAQPLVRRSYRDPVETFETNALGTVSVYEACRSAAAAPLAVVCITSDKVYENREWTWGYRETDSLGGYDPYSCSKACAELITSCYRNSYFNLAEYGHKHHTLVAIGRAGNVIGGGDWAEDRLVPDLVRATLAGRPVVLRNPGSVRPWQHVLESLSGYLQLGQKLLERDVRFADAWNFGPGPDGAVAVETVVRQFQAAWPRVECVVQREAGAPHEAGLLSLDCAKARSKLGWFPVWTWTEAVKATADWYRQFQETGTAASRSDLATYVAAARRQNLPWSRR
jgi:CDP-glucose 4,6-dehydratase